MKSVSEETRRRMNDKIKDELALDLEKAAEAGEGLFVAASKVAAGRLKSKGRYLGPTSWQRLQRTLQSLRVALAKKYFPGKFLAQLSDKGLRSFNVLSLLMKKGVIKPLLPQA